jgi:spermidine/putrescine-binding protein
MKTKFFGFLMVVLLFILAACGGGPGGPELDTAEEASSGAGSIEPQELEEGPQLAAQLSVYNWDDYIDEELLDAYEAEYGVDIIYDTFASNEDLLAKLQAGATGFDVIFPSDYMVSQMLELGLLAEIDTNEMPNFANIGDDFRDPPFDPGNAHCVPYQWGTTGLGYSAGYEYFAENEPNSWAYLFEPELLENYAADGINVLNDQRELLAAALFYLGYSPNSTDEAQLAEARDLILEAKPYWKTFNSEDYDDTLLVPGEVVLSQAGAAMWPPLIGTHMTKKQKTATGIMLFPRKGRLNGWIISA